MALATLSLLETRILGTLSEKERTVPDSYPLTRNALASGCNQKTSRDPVIEASDAEIQAGIDSLKGYSLVMELPRLPGARENRWAHLLSGTPEVEQPAVRAAPNADVSVGEVAALKANVARLESEVVALRALVGKVCAELGIDPSRSDKS